MRFAARRCSNLRRLSMIMLRLEFIIQSGLQLRLILRASLSGLGVSAREDQCRTTWIKDNPIRLNLSPWELAFPGGIYIYILRYVFLLTRGNFSFTIVFLITIVFYIRNIQIEKCSLKKIEKKVTLEKESLMYSIKLW